MNITNLSASEALAKLKEGNNSYIHEHYTKEVHIRDIVALDDHGQHPFATVITCSDSRVPPELIFNCGLGEIFTIRTAGNVVSDFEIGSAEYAAEHLHTNLIVVMGHLHCGAVASACEEHGEVGGYLGHIMHEIEPSVEEARRCAHCGEEVAELAENYNIEHTVNILKNNEVIKEMPEVLVLGAKYNTHTGVVEFFE